MELAKRLKKPIKLFIAKPVSGHNELFPNSKGGYNNECQDLTFITFGEFKSQLRGVRAMGFSIAKIIDFGDAEKDAVQSVFDSVYKSKPIKSNDSLDAIKEQNELLKKQNEDQAKKIDMLLEKMGISSDDKPTNSNTLIDSGIDDGDDNTDDSDDMDDVQLEKEILFEQLEAKGISFKKSFGVDKLKGLLND